MEGSLVVETKGRGRPSNQSRMGAGELAAAELACAALMTAWEKMAFCRERGVHHPDYSESVAGAVAAMRGARDAGLTWRDVGEAIGIGHQSALKWFRRHDEAAKAPEEPGKRGPAWRPIESPAQEPTESSTQ